MNRNASPKPLSSLQASISKPNKTHASSIIASAKNEVNNNHNPPVKHFIGVPPLIGDTERKKIGVRAVVTQPGTFSKQRSLSPLGKDASYDSKLEASKFEVAPLMEYLPAHQREFFQFRKDFIKYFEEFDKTATSLDEVNERVKCYRVELGIVIDQVNVNFRNILTKILEATIRLHTETQTIGSRQIEENLKIIEKLEREKKELELKNRNLKNLQNFQESEYKICKLNMDSLQTEIGLLHELLKKDLLSLINHLGTIENINQKGHPKEDPSENLVNGVASLNTLIVNLENENTQKQELMGGMNNLLKAMLKGNKEDAYTQVDEGELLWAPNLFFTDDKLGPNLLTLGEADSAAVNLDLQMQQKAKQTNNNIDMLVLKERELTPMIPDVTTTPNTSSLTGENWMIPLKIIIFLDNATRLKESGRVLPWNHFRKLIFNIYIDWVSMESEMRGALTSTFMTLDEFTCIHFLKMYKLRRIAELKLFEFLVSLKYYAKLWPRATTFVNLCGISTSTKLAVVDLNLTFTFDIYIQNYFLICFGKITSDSQYLFEQTDGFTWLLKSKCEEYSKELLAFLPSQQISRFTSKFIPKNSKKVTNPNNHTDELFEAVDVDKFLDALLDEYLEARKRNIKLIAKNFSKLLESENGLFALEDIREVFQTLNTYISNPFPGYSFPKEFHFLKVFLYSLTSSKNKFDILNKDFLAACIKFGLDSPFPTIIQGAGNLFRGEKALIIEDSNTFDNPKSKTFQQPLKRQGTRESLVRLSSFGQTLENRRKDSLIAIIDEAKEEGDIKAGSGILKSSPSFDEKINTSAVALTVDVGSAMFAQHFGILRELRHKCVEFKEAIKHENDPEEILKQFEKIVNILDAGCQFLNFPIQL